MENLTIAKQRKKRVDSKNDRISKLPEPILHHILCLLDQRTAATTSVLSKSWRYLWCTRPKIEFDDGFTMAAGQNKEGFLSVLDRTLRGYRDRQLHLQELTLHLSRPDSNETASFLRKWIRILVQSMGVNQFHLRFTSTNYSSDIKTQLRSSIFRSESLVNLSLDRCVLKSIPAEPPLHLKHLQKLILYDVVIPEEVLKDILSNCRSLEHVSLEQCTGFKRIELKHTAANLKEFCFNDDERGGTCFAMGEGDISTLRTLDIEHCFLSFNRKGQFYFSQLRKLMMTNVTLSSTDLFSCDLPCLEELTLDYCSGIKELNLSSPSMKRMEIHNSESKFKVTVNAPSMVSFHYGGVFPQSISFSAAATSWKSYIDLTFFLNEPLLCLNDLIGLLKALSRSEIFVKLLESTVQRLREQLLDMSVGVSYDDLPLVVDHLILAENMRSPSAGDILNSLFLMLRPKFIYMSCDIEGLTETQRVTELILNPGEMYRREFWEPFLEGAVTMQVFYSNRRGEWWEPFKPEILSKLISKKYESMDQNCIPIDMERRIKLMIFN